MGFHSAFEGLRYIMKTETATGYIRTIGLLAGTTSLIKTRALTTPTTKFNVFPKFALPNG
jgi:hypothetical protein